MSNSDNIVIRCVTIGKIPATYNSDDVVSLVKKHKPKFEVVALDKIPGGETEDDFEKWIVLMNNKDDADAIQNDDHIADRVGDDDHQFTLHESTSCDVPESWLSAYKSDGRVLVSNLPDNVDEEFLEMFFESKQKSDGGKVASVYHNTKEKTAIIEFVDFADGQRVLKHQSLKMKNTSVKVQEFQPYSDISEEKRVVVSDLPDVDEEFLEMFFENRNKSDGGKISSIDFNSKEKTAILEFEEVEAAQRVLQKKSLKMKKKLIQVAAYQPIKTSNMSIDEKEKDLNTKLIVSNLPEKVDSDFLGLFFESKKRFGGVNIVCIELDEENATAIIEFKNEEEVQTVLNKVPITMKNKVVEVGLFQPEVKRDIAEDLLGGDGSPYRVLLTDLPITADREYLEMFFENKRTFGGIEVSSIELIMEYSAALMEFSNSEAVNTVLRKQPIMISNKEIHVYPYNPQEHSLDTIEVQGPSDIMNTDLLEMYFENEKKSNGGEIVDISIDENDETYTAYIQLKNEKVAARVVEKDSHHIGNKQLQVKLYEHPDQKIEFLKKNAPNQNGDLDRVLQKQDKHEQKKKTTDTVKVKGIKNARSMETIQLYFENENRSSGGPIVDVTYDDEDENILFITFESPKVAEKVAERGTHQVEGCDMTVVLYNRPEPRPMYTNKVLVNGLKPTTTKDCLFNYLESKSGGCIAEEELLGKESSIRLVTFRNEIDFARLQSNLRPLEGAYLTVENVQVSNCISVFNYDETYGKDALELYFENSARSGGGQIDKVTFNEDQGYWLIYFNDYKVIDNVLSKEHTLNGNKLDVQLFIECLGIPEGGKNQRTFKLPDPIFFEDIESHKINFLLGSETIRTSFEKKMECSHTKVVWPTSDTPLIVKIECTLSPDMRKLYKLTKTWHEIAEKEFNDFIETIVVKKQNILQDLWEKVLTGVDNIEFDLGHVAVFKEREHSAIFVAGIKLQTEAVADKINKVVKKVEEGAERAKQRVKETTTTLKSIHVKMLNVSNYPKKMEEKHEYLKLKIDIEKNEVVFEGLSNEVQNAKLEMFELIHVFSTRECQDKSESSLRLYQNEQVRSYIEQLLKEQNMNMVTVWEVIRNKLVVCSMNEEVFGLGLEIVRDAVRTFFINLTKENAGAVKTDKWNDMVKYTYLRFPDRVCIDLKSDEVCVSTTDDIANEIESSVKAFLKENSIITDVLSSIGSHMLRLLTNNHKHELENIGKGLESDQVQILTRHFGFEIHGNEQGIKHAKKQLLHLISKIESKDHQISKPGLSSHIKTSDGEIVIKAVETQMPCVIKIKGQEDMEESVHISGDRDMTHFYPDFQMSKSNDSVCRTPDNREIITKEGDMTVLNVETLVNSADKSISLAGGLGKLIVKKGGDTILKACKSYIAQNGELNEGDVFVSTGGDLSVRHIIHVVGPAWQDGKHREIDRLKEAVCKVMKQASLNKCKSIAIPAISCGAYGFQARVATLAIVQSIQNFFREEQDSPVKTIYLCDIKPETIQGFNDALNQSFDRLEKLSAFESARSKQRTSPQYLKETTYPGLAPETQIRRQQETKVVIGKTNISIVKGELAKEKVDAIVNSVSQTLDLNIGSVSNSLLRAAGQGLQDEVRAIHPDTMKHGEVVNTKGHNLKCKMVMHIALPSYSGESSLKILRKSIVECLEEANERNFSSIAFPVLGTGNLNFPHKSVAKEMYTAVQDYTRKVPQSSLSQIKFVLYHKDTKIIKAFEKEEMRWISRTEDVSIPGFYRTKDRFAKTDDCADDMDQNTFVDVDRDDNYFGDEKSICYENIKIVVKQGDVTLEACDCIVNYSNEDLDLTSGVASQALLNKGGNQLKIELESKHTAMKKDHVVVTSAPNLHCDKIMHVNSQGMDGTQQIEACLNRCEEDGIRCIAFPALGTSDDKNIKVNKEADVIGAALKAFCESKPKSVKEVRILIYNQDMVQYFKQAVEKQIVPDNKGYLELFKAGYKWITGDSKGNKEKKKKSKSLEIADTVTFTIYSMSSSTIDLASKRLEFMLESGVFKKTFRVDVIKQLTEEEETQLKNRAAEHQVKMTLITKDGSIDIWGFTNNVSALTDEIHGFLHEKETQMYEEKRVQLMNEKMIQWFFIDITEDRQIRERYEQNINRNIEDAYQAKKKTFEFSDSEGKSYVINFDKMEEYIKDEPTSSVRVIRSDLLVDNQRNTEGYFEQPTNWDTMNEDENLTVVSLQSSSKEYKDLETNFKAFVGKNYNVTKIERVQNKSLWQQYQVKRKQFEKQNPADTANEKQLWHGCEESAMDSINAHGFNRSYCGKNAVRFGNGVYFATDAGFSTKDTYSKPDSRGIKRLYYCKVLTGEFAEGKPDMRTPPPKSGSYSGALYDSVVNNMKKPEIFVIFNDTQAYPEYIISFKS